MQARIEQALAGKHQTAVQQAECTKESWPDGTSHYFADSLLEGDLLQIDLQSPHVFAMRRAVRKLAERGLKQAAIVEQLRNRRQAYEAREAERRKRDRALAVNLRRCVLRVVPDQGPPAAAALLDIGQRAIRSFVGSELLELPAVLQDYDLIAALWTRETLYSLGIGDHDPWRLVDLKDIVNGSAPGWSDPWSRSVRVKILSFDFTFVTVESSQRTWTIPRHEIQAIRAVV